MRVNRRRFFGLAGAAAAVAALPKPLLALESPPAEVDFELAAATIQSANERISARESILDAYLYSLPYWNVAEHSGTYCGIERSAKP